MPYNFIFKYPSGRLYEFLAPLVVRLLVGDVEFFQVFIWQKPSAWLKETVARKRHCAHHRNSQSFIKPVRFGRCPDRIEVSAGFL